MRLLFALLLVVLGSVARADTCETETSVCLARGNVEVDGILLTDVCLSLEKSEHCVRDEPVDSCSAFPSLTVGATSPLSDGQCSLVEETCTRLEGGICDTWERTYNCWNGPAVDASAELINRSYRNFEETIESNCDALEGDGSCTFVDTVMVEGPESRLINHHAVNRLWWARDKRFSCTGSGPTDTCGSIVADPVCRENAEAVCQSFDEEGACTVWERSFHCYADPSVNPQCEEINVCADGSCDLPPEEPDDNFAQSAAWLNFLDAAADQNTCTMADGEPLEEGDEPQVANCEGGSMDLGNDIPEVFQGRRMTCERGFSNCCDNDFEGSCSSSEIELTHLRIARQTHRYRSRCTRRFFGACIEVREYHCAYGSKFARVFQQQVNRQTGAQFPYGSPYCPGLTIEQLESIDFNTLDLSEVFGDMLADIDIPVEELVIDRLSQDLGLIELDVQETLR